MQLACELNLRGPASFAGYTGEVAGVDVGGYGFRQLSGQILLC
jgi:hypothetical protein